MAKRLLGAGFKVTVWNRTPGPGSDALAAAGATVAPSAAAALASADITFAMLADPAAARAVVAQAVDGAAGKAAGGWGYVDVSTVDAATARAVGTAIHAAGGRFLEAPVSGSKAPAEGGQLIFLAAGDADLYERAGPALDAMGKARFLLGEGTPGAGARMKLAVNALMGTMAVALGEALAVGEAAGLDTKALVEVVGLGAVAAPMFALKGPGMAAPAPRSYPPAFPLKHQAKDLRLYEALAREVGVATPLGDAAGAVFAAAEAEGLGEDDFVAVREVCGE
jgi:glyoxylate/succinic semialdehyde reductase